MRLPIILLVGLYNINSYQYWNGYILPFSNLAVYLFHLYVAFVFDYWKIYLVIYLFCYLQRVHVDLVSNFFCHRSLCFLPVPTEAKSTTIVLIRKGEWEKNVLPHPQNSCNISLLYTFYGIRLAYFQYIVLLIRQIEEKVSRWPYKINNKHELWCVHAQLTFKVRGTISKFCVASCRQDIPLGGCKEW